MRLVAIINSWDDFEWLKICIENIRPLVDGIIVVISYTSNFGENRQGPDGSTYEFDPGKPIFFRQCNPLKTLSVRDNETRKRNFGLDFARALGRYTHFLMLDTDEMYDPAEFLKAKELFKNPDLNGLVCPLRVYFRSPTLWCEDITLVPFIHKLTPTIRHEFNRRYPFAWDGPQIRIDPTRSLNINSGVEFTKEVTMHHMSWVRKDFEKKIRNSTARANLERSTIREDLANAKPGYFCKFYQRQLKECENRFNIHLNES